MKTERKKYKRWTVLEIFESAKGRPLTPEEIEKFNILAIEKKWMQKKKSKTK